MRTDTRQKAGLDRAIILKEALALLQQTSLAELTVRNLADRLGIRAASLYIYFPNKAALVSAMSERMFMESLKGVPLSDDWRQWMREVGRKNWEVLMGYPDSAVLVLTSEISDERFHFTSSTARDCIAKLGLHPERGFALFTAIQSTVLGAVGFAQSPFAAKLDAAVDLKADTFSAIDALIEGWKWEA